MSNAENPFGSARFATEAEIRRAGMFQQTPNALFVGFYEGRPLWYDDMGGGVIIAGARSGKLRDVLGYNVCAGIHAGSMFILDVKRELASISIDQTPDGKFCGYWNPAGYPGLPQDRVNPVDYAHADNPTLVSDLKMFAEQMVPPSGSSNGVFFEGRAREYMEAISLAIVQQDGVLTLPALYHAIKGISSSRDKWLNLAFEMSESKNEDLSDVEAEIADGQKNASGGFHGIIGELKKSVACLSDPTLRKSVSPPFTLSMDDLTKENQPWQFYMVPPAEFVRGWAPVLKAFFTSGRIYKGRAPWAPPQTWVLDECAQLGAFPALIDLFTIGAGLGIRPYAVFQSTKQMKALGPDAENIILSSAALRQFFGVRDLETATTLSRMLGTETLSYEDEMRSEQARHAQQKAMQTIIDGGDPLDAALSYDHASRQGGLSAKRGRSLMTPDEILNMPKDKQLLYVDGLPHPICADRRPYYEQRFMAGRYHPNPYYPPADRVRVKTLFGHGWKKVVREPVPGEFAHYPQYHDGFWSKVR